MTSQTGSASDIGPVTMAESATVIPQRCVLVLPSTGEFDSRTYRIARTLHERGHEVTVLARWRPGLERSERHPVGYRILRVEASAIDGVPVRWFWTRLRTVVRRLTGRAGPTEPTTDIGRGAIGEAPVGDPGAGWSHPVASPTPGPTVLGRVANSLVRRFRIFLMLRSHRRAALAVSPPADVWHGMAYMGIPICLSLRARHGGSAVYDSRDIYMEAANLANMRGPVKWLLAWRERRWARGADRVLTVNDPYADELARRFAVERPLVVMNCSYRYDPPDPPRRRFHERLDLDPSVRIVLYQGGFSPGRGIEELLEAVHRIDRCVLVCMGYGVLEPQLRSWADDPRHRGRLFVLPAVDPTELLDWVAAADVVGALFQRTTLNHRLSTPNKFLEAMAAGVPTIVSDDPGMAPIATATGCGIAVDPDDIEAIARAIRTIVDASSEGRDAWRSRAIAAAHATYNWETQVERLLAEYGRLTGRPW
jgi:glycosyltransferase involved in cell wall biosynthesis